MFGTLPAYGFYARHVNGLTLDNVHIGAEKPMPVQRFSVTMSAA